MEITAKPGLRLGAGHFGLMFRVLNRTRFGRIRVILPDGSEHDFIGDEPGPQAEIEFRNRRVLRRMLTNGSNGFAEGYLAGDFETPDLAALLELGARNEDAWGNFLTRTTMLAGLHRLMHVLRPNSKRGARRNISHHYDLGNRFYSAWLDRSLTYSSAVFDGADQPLEAAQTNKYANIAALGGLKPGDHVLEIGCGWGGFALYAAKSLGCRVTGLTISQEQFEHVRARIAAEGLQDRVEVRFQDYRDTQGVFDRVVSIEMFEAVGERYWDPFFSKLNEVLRPGGTAALQVITIAEDVWPSYRRSADFIQRYIFPGGVLPPRRALVERAQGAGLAWLADRGYGIHYARTLALWHQRFCEAWPEIGRLGFDERFQRMWRYYLAYCEAGFRAGRIDVLQMALRRP